VELLQRPPGRWCLDVEYTEQLTYLLFPKMAHARETRPLKPERIVPAHCSWQRLLDADGDDLERTDSHRLEDLARQLDITWLKDASLEDLDDLPAPEVTGREIVDDLTAALADFEAVAAALEEAAGSAPSAAD
jgi:hypothetical protein